MSEFKKQIEKAQTRQRVIILSSAVIALAAFLIMAASVFLLKGTIIQIQPLDAQQNARVSVLNGMAVYFDGSLLSLSRFPTIEVSSEGFKPGRKQISAQEEGAVAQITLEPLPATIRLTTNIDNEDTAWFINGQRVEVTSSLVRELEAGEYKITASHPYYDPVTLPLTLKRADLVEKQIDLSLLTGRLEISSLPKEAQLSIGSKDPVLLPVNEQLTGGQYQLTISKENYVPITDSVEITNTNKVIVRQYRLKQRPASVNISVFPTGGKLTLNGKPVKTGQALELSPNQRYFLKYYKKGFGSTERTLNLSPGQTVSLALKLKLKLGNVILKASPAASVFIDGKPVGNTPLSLRLPAYEHKISFHKQGYQTEVRTILPSPKTDKSLTVTLSTQAEARRSKAKASYKNALGQSMILFKPNKIILGAPRSEKGQRANEFIRNVTLKRYFYVSETEVTAAQFRQYKPGKTTTASSLPITNVSWLEAAKFCNWLSQRENLEPFYRIKKGQAVQFNPQANGYRLPSEAEWEWLARKANKRQQTKFTWGDEDIIPEEAGNIADEAARGKTRFFVPNYIDGHATVAPVSSYPKEPSQLFDIFGNVAEWVTDYYSLLPPDKGAEFVDPLGAEVSDKHVVKGASWASGSLTELRPSFRAPAMDGSDKIGFRIARYL
ncbi:SUMF1/EgtB/PvdO family nonheme iron enzyme [Sneathiella aquimaris]|uniref:SUMF1/EgtB/PvdO family nonheme iron enzyme n=1 Tax=Sneathiella aquimaris TaxID=2599305 RepID=UPI00146D7CCA|nr:SUMF1/EgtB/PvdO family nonheme iron enzyme [Sneathiella aquimaris]